MINVNYINAALSQATAIMMKVEELAKKSHFHATFDVSTYENGRERGFYVKCRATGKAVTFSEYRNTDQIVIYSGKIDQFTGEQLITPEIYANKLFVGYGQFDKAAKMVFEFLVS